METSKEMFMRMREQDFNELPQQMREKFTYIEVRQVNEYEENKDDETYIAYYKAYKKAKDSLQKYVFNKRHKINSTSQ